VLLKKNPVFFVKSAYFLRYALFRKSVRGQGTPDINQKVESRTEYRINLRSGDTDKKIFTSTERISKKAQLLNGRSEKLKI
jgi:hypothetical protein